MSLSSSVHNKSNLKELLAGGMNKTICTTEDTEVTEKKYSVIQML
ncbi:MAG: hypothetical protein BMS9Abin26_1170 [Gammaproteobacteria bacterium]|nr:MAG: hypothetical protein BMS9Abin26_1170 [Gammaproteobacteria bacterium]